MLRNSEEENVFDLDSIEDVLSGVDMAWAQPQHSRREVNEAGASLLCFMRSLSGKQEEIEHTIEPEEIEHALDVVDNFRAAHAFPMNTMQIFLRRQANTLDEDSIVAQRLKRLSSIWMKLNRFETMGLWDMQDIGGCRAVVNNLADIERLVEAYKSSRIRHKLSHEDDYVQQPRLSGYRSMHLVYRYISDRNEVYNGLKVEIQIRSPLQHAWATTVETVDAFTQQALKSSRGRRDWERFFQLMGTQMAFRENTTPVEGTPTEIKELRRELRECANELNVITRLAGFATALQVTERASARKQGADYFLLSLDNVKERLSVTGYKRTELKQAYKAYANREKQIRKQNGTDAVLVSVDSISYLRRAYPNYFADTSMFVKELKEALR